MRIVECLAPVLGQWQGVHRQRLLPTDEFVASDATASVTVTAREYVSLAYTWSDGDAPQEGLLLLSGGSGPEGVSAVWLDSWHSSPAWMLFAGTVGEDGVVRLTGSYAAPEGPDWGWQIFVAPVEGGGGRMTMLNLVPGEAPYEAVEAVYDHRV
ncbi:DUF1579 family protein [Oerskovia enterophila]|uniref:DUF1579 family protein n=1 Tax=Oerskovia enterophila TaxID=43678 RepID=UPI003390941C